MKIPTLACLILLGTASCSSARSRDATGGAATETGGGPGSGGASVQTGSGGASVQSGGKASGGGTATGGSGGGTTTGGTSASGGSPSGVGAGGAASNLGGAASGGQSPASGGSASSDYQPCPAQGPCRILPLGDSITVGVGSSDGGGYRVPLFSAAVAASQSITFVGSSEESGPNMVSGVAFPKSNEGHSGIGTASLSDLLTASLAANTPHIVLLHIGTNDAEEDQADRPSPQALGALLDKISVAAPNALVVVAQIIPINVDNAGLQQGLATYNAAIPGLVAERAAAGKHVAFVDMNGPFVANPNYKTAYLADTVHPNDAGYQVIAGIWYQAISGFLH